MDNGFLLSSMAQERDTLSRRLSYLSLIVTGAGTALAHASGR